MEGVCKAKGCLKEDWDKTGLCRLHAIKWKAKQTVELDAPLPPDSPLRTEPVHDEPESRPWKTRPPVEVKSPTAGNEPACMEPPPSAVTEETIPEQSRAAVPQKTEKEPAMKSCPTANCTRPAGHTGRHNNQGANAPEQKPEARSPKPEAPASPVACFPSELTRLARAMSDAFNLNLAIWREGERQVILDPSSGKSLAIDAEGNSAPCTVTVELA
jgi:hypothetical protein